LRQVKKLILLSSITVFIQAPRNKVLHKLTPKGINVKKKIINACN